MTPSPPLDFVGTQHGDMTCLLGSSDGLVTVLRTLPRLRMESRPVQLRPTGGVGPPVPRLPPESSRVLSQSVIQWM
jgi:hypothetical protein